MVATRTEIGRCLPGNTGYMTNLDLGDMPFLRVFDVRYTELLSVNASKCPRLEKVYADGTGLSTIDLAETAPISTLTLPDTMTELVLNNLPNDLSRRTYARRCRQGSKDICK